MASLSPAASVSQDSTRRSSPACSQTRPTWRSDSCNASSQVTPCNVSVIVRSRSTASPQTTVRPRRRLNRSSTSSTATPSNSTLTLGREEVSIRAESSTRGHASTLDVTAVGRSTRTANAIRVLSMSWVWYACSRHPSRQPAGDHLGHRPSTALTTGLASAPVAPDASDGAVAGRLAGEGDLFTVRRPGRNSSSPGSGVTRRCEGEDVEVGLFMRSRTNTSRRPPGDQAGYRSFAFPRVSRSTVPVATSSRQRLHVPLRFDSNAVRVPSGLHAGARLADSPSVSGRAAGCCAAAQRPRWAASAA